MTEFQWAKEVREGWWFLLRMESARHHKLSGGCDKGKGCDKEGRAWGHGAPSLRMGLMLSALNVSYGQPDLASAFLRHTGRQLSHDRPEIRQHLKWLLAEESRLRRQGWLN